MAVLASFLPPAKALLLLSSLLSSGSYSYFLLLILSLHLSFFSIYILIFCFSFIYTTYLLHRDHTFFTPFFFPLLNHFIIQLGFWTRGE